MGHIEPVSLPSAAGQNFGEGDVRHFSEGDSVTVPGLSNPTRHLAARDSLLAEKLNETITEVNNKEQIIPLPIYRMVVPPSTEEIVANHRIPNGYEARVLNAAVSSTPTSSDIELNIFWAAGFGNVAGTAVMTTTSESAGGTTFSPAGEFIIQVKNKGSVTLDVVASVFITMRPITDLSGALLPAATVPPPGPPGPKGEKGGKGDDGGAGPAGSPGLIFRGQWTRVPPPISYAANDVVTHDFAGTSRRSAYVCLQSHIANGVNEPQPELVPTPFWDFLAEAGEAGSSGSSGSIGSSVAFSSISLQGTITTGGDFVAASPSWNTSYSNQNVVAASTVYKVPVLETTALNPTGSPAGVASLKADFRTAFRGGINFKLPDETNNGAAVDYTPAFISLIAVPHGTEVTSFGTWVGPEITPTTNGWDVFVRGSEPIPMQITVIGSQIVV